MVGDTTSTRAAAVREGEKLVVLFFNCNGFEVLGFENLAAVETFNVFHAVSPRNHFGTGVLASVLHKARLRLILLNRDALSRGWPQFFSES
ncbi:MAG: hypothetical protein ABSH50_16425 [Bryobacteraceae bacterium]|jgi:hypothetical protein